MPGALAAMAAMAALTILAGCATPPAPAPSAAALPVIGPVEVSTGVELLAEAYRNYAMVTIINHTDKTILVGPKFFSVIANKKRYGIDPKNVLIQFPIRELQREEGASGAFLFRNLTTVEGQKLVFNSPDAPPTFVLIKSYQARQPNYEPTARPLGRGESRELQQEQEKIRQLLMEHMKTQQPRP